MQTPIVMQPLQNPPSCSSIVKNVEGANHSHRHQIFVGKTIMYSTYTSQLIRVQMFNDDIYVSYPP
jgi:hypothetical protein